MAKNKGKRVREKDCQVYIEGKLGGWGGDEGKGMGNSRMGGN